MKKRLFSLLLVSALVFTLSGCREKFLLRESDPVTLNFWHVYGEQSGSPMDLLVQEFNRTVGQKKASGSFSLMPQWWQNTGYSFSQGAQSRHRSALMLNMAEDTYRPHWGHRSKAHRPSVSHAISSASSSVSARMDLVTQHSSPEMSQ